MHTGNTNYIQVVKKMVAVYPCAYREHFKRLYSTDIFSGLSLCIQGTLEKDRDHNFATSVYPCAYREHTFPRIPRTMFFGLSLCIQGTLGFNRQQWGIITGLSLCIQGTRSDETVMVNYRRFIPVHTGNTFDIIYIRRVVTVYPCAYREHHD